MARRGRRGISYFSVDVDIFSDRKLRRVMHAHGPGAMAVVMRALCCIYGENGYYIEADGDFIFDLADELNVEEAYVRGVLQSCVETGFFDRPLFEERRVLTSRRIQRNYREATKRRDDAGIDPAYEVMADDPVSVCGNGEIVCNNSDNACRNAENADRSTQSKVNKNKPKEIKTHGKACAGGVSVPADYVTLSDGERARLSGEFGEAAAVRMIELLGSYKGATGKRYESDYCAIRGWVVRRWREENANAAKPAYFERASESYDHLAVDLFAGRGG